MRCQYCDFEASNSNSVYSTGIKNNHNKENKVIYDVLLDMWICLDCSGNLCYEDDLLDIDYDEESYEGKSLNFEDREE